MQEKVFVTCEGQLYECDSRQWRSFLEGVRDKKQTDIGADTIKRNEMFIRVGREPIDMREITSASAEAILEGLPHPEEIAHTQQEIASNA